MRKRLSYSLEILYNKWSPFIISLILFIYHILLFLFPWDLEIVLYLCLPSIFTSVHMYNSRLAFKFCKVHRCFVNYTIGNIFASIVEHYWIVPYMNIEWLAFILFGTILAISLGLYYYIIEHDKINYRPVEEVSR